MLPGFVTHVSIKLGHRDITKRYHVSALMLTCASTSSPEVNRELTFPTAIVPPRRASLVFPREAWVICNASGSQHDHGSSEVVLARFYSVTSGEEIFLVARGLR
jgi:hypothetical protein